MGYVRRVSTVSRVRLFVYTLLVWQCIQAAPLTRIDRFQESEWLLSYKYGFVRRGLGGTILAMFPGAPTTMHVHFAIWLTAIASIGSVVVLLWILTSYPTLPRVGIAILMVAMPWGPEQMLTQRGIELLVVPVFVAFALNLLSVQKRAWWWLIVGAGISYGLLEFLHEGSFIMFGSWGMFMILSNHRRTWLHRLLSALIFAAPSAIAMLVISRCGASGSGIEERWLNDPVVLALIDNPRQTLLGLVGDSLWESMRYVMWMLPPHHMVMMCLWGLITLAIAGVWMHRWVRLTLHLDWLGWVGVAIPVVSYCLLLLVGTDWQRWFCYGGFGLLVVASAHVLHGVQPPALDSMRELPTAMLPVAVYLASRPQVQPMLTTETWLDFIKYWI